MLTAGGMQPLRALALHQALGGDVRTIAPPAIELRHRRWLPAGTEGLSAWQAAEVIREGDHDAVVVQKWPWLCGDHRTGPLFADALEAAARRGARLVFVRRLVAPYLERHVAAAIAQLQPTVVDGEGHWTGGRVRWAGTTRQIAVGCPADLDHGWRPPSSPLVLAEWLRAPVLRPERVLCTWGGAPAELTAHGIDFDAVAVTPEQQLRASRPVARHDALEQVLLVLGADGA